MALDPRLSTFGFTGSDRQGNTYRFPLADMERYKGRIYFRASQEETSTVSQQLIDTFTGTNNAFGLSQAVDAAGAQTIADIRGTAPSLQTRNTGITDIIPQGSVTLFLPSSLQFSDEVSYSGMDLGIVGSAAAAGIREGDNLAQLARRGFNAAFPSFESLQEAVTKGLTGEAAQVAAIRTSRRINSEVAGAISSATGLSLNPNKRSILQEVPIRSFQFTFKLIPTTASEAKTIGLIIKWFRLNMYPEAVSTGNIAFKYPSKFDIGMSYGGKKVATGILPCFLERVSTTYNAAGMGFHSDGEFQETDVTLVFREERALTKADIEGGY